MTAVRLRTILLAATLGVAALAASAQTVEENVLSQLRQQGYVDFQVSHTLLGRLHIVAVSADYRREIVINPNNGEILRDYITAIGSSGGAPLIVIPDRRLDDDGGGSDNSGHGGGDDDDGDDDDSGGDDDDDDDEGDDD